MALNQVADNKETFNKEFMAWLTSSNRSDRFINSLSVVLQASRCTESQYDEYYDIKAYNQVIANLTDFFKNLSEGKYPIDVYARIYSVENIQGKVKYSPSYKWKILGTVIHECSYRPKAEMDNVFSDIQKMIMDEIKIPLELLQKLEGNNPIYKVIRFKVSCTMLKNQINDIEKFSGKGILAEEINKLKNSIRFDDKKYVVISQDLVLVKPIYRIFSLLLKDLRKTSSLKPSLDFSSVQNYDFSIDDKSLEYELEGSWMYIPEAIDLLYHSYEIARGWLIQMQKQSDPSYATLAKYLHDQESIAPKETTPEWSNIWHTDNKLAAAITALLNDNKKKLSSIFMLGSFSQSPRLDKLKQCFSTIDTSCKTGYLTRLEDLLADLNQSKPLTSERNTFALQCITVMNNHDEAALDKIISWFPQINEVVEYLRENIKSTKELERAASEHTEIREGTYHVRGEMLVLLVRIWSIIDSNKADCVKLISDLIGASSHIQASKISQKSDNIKKYIAFFNSPESRDKQKNNLFRILNESTIFFTWVSETTFEMNIKITNSNKPINSNFATGDQRNQQDANVEAAADTFTIVNDKEFIALYDRAVLFTEILSDNSRNDSVYKCFQDIGKMAIDSLAILNRFAKSGELINIFRAILCETEYTMNQLTYQQVREDERAICCTIGEDKSSDLTTLYECLYSLAERATAAKNQVFDFDKISKNLSILPWCTFTGVQLSFLLDYMKKSHMDDQSIAPTRRDELMISNLLSNLDDSIEDHDALSEQTKLENINTEITYEAILKLDMVFKERAHILPEDKFDARLKVCFYVSGQDRTEKLITIFDFLFREGEHSSRCLFCTRFSKEEEITSFLFRATCDPLEREYLVVDLHLLDTKLRDTIIRVLCDRSSKYKSRGDFLNTRITFLVPDKHETNLSIELTRRNTTSFREVSMPTSQTLQRNYYFEKHSHIVLVTSAKAGQGKTHWINRQVESHGEKLLVLNLSGKMSPAVLTQRLESIFSTLNKEKDESRYSLRIKIDIVDGLEESFDYLNQLLFKICYLRCVEFDVSYLSFQPISTFYIEVQNTFDDRLMNIPFITYLRNLNARQNSSLLNHNICKILDPDTIDVRELKKLGLVDTLRFMNLMEPVSTIDKLKFIGILNIYDISDVEANHYFLQEETLIENMDNKQEQRQAREKLCKKRHTWNKDRNCIESQEISKKFIKLEEISNRLIQALHQADLYREKSKVLYKLATSYTSTADELKRFGKLREMLQNHIKNGKDAMLLLKFDRSSAFDSDFANALSEDHKLLEDEALKQHIIYKLEDLFSEHTSTTQEEQDLMLSRLNFYHLKIVLSLLSTQAQELAECESLTYGLSNEFETLELKRQFIDMRNKLADKILQQTREFAYSQVMNITQLQESQVSKRNQHISQNAITSAENSIEGGQNMESSTLKNVEKKVELKNFVWLLVQGGSVKIIYRTVNSIDENTLWLYESQYLKRENNSERKLKDLVTQQDFILELVEAFWTLSPEETLQRARQIESRIIQNEKRFMFTLDNYMKIRLIMLRVNLRIPILLLGESGCGKTFILEFIAINFFCDTFELLVFHSGISERNFENFVDNCIEKANKDRNKRLWMFFDEINTTPLIPIISELVTERKAHFATKQNNELPDNIIVVCACNPFKFRSMDVDEEKSRRAEKAQLTHKVYPIPESLVSFSFNFGQLSPEDEITYIKSILRDEKIADLDPNFMTTLSEALQLGQQFLRKNDSESAASIRDIRRFTRLIAVFQRFGNYSIAEALMLGFYVCYSIRKRSDETTFREYRERIEEFNDQIQSRLSSILNKHNVRERSLERLFDTACQLYTKEVKRLKCWPDDISDNRPVRENLFIVINCLIAKVPLFICGRPGTSKTVSILIAKKLFEVSSQEKEQSTLFKQLPQAEFFQIWGSKEMSAEQVQRHFDKTRAYSKSYAKRRREDPKLPEKLFIVYFEEMGRADTNENNPLKVMHPLLEPREAENLEAETECFIGVSNTTLDASKMSRMLYVPRCEMDRDELIATLVDYRIDERIRSKCPDLLRDVSIELCLVDAYVDYRAFEMKDDWHSSYYGPRDFYAMSKWINQNMDVLLEAIDNHPDLSKSVILQFFILSIERNFSGRMIVQPSMDGLRNENKNSSFFMKRMFLTRFSKAPEGAPGPIGDDMIRLLDKRIGSMYLIMSNLADPNARHLLVTLDQSLFTENFVRSLKSHLQNMHIKCGKKWEDRKFVYLNSDPTDITTLFNRFLEYISQGFIVVMRNMDNLYSSFYDLFNKKYTIKTESDGKQRKFCQVSIGDQVVDELEVNDDFKCIILIDNDGLKGQNTAIMHSEREAEVRQPTALLNRFEKHIILGKELLSTEQLATIHKLKEIVNSQLDMPERCIHNYGQQGLLIESLVLRSDNNLTMSFENFRYEDFIRAKVNLDSKLESNTSELYEIPELDYSKINTDPKDIENCLERLSSMFNSNYLYFICKKYSQDPSTRQKLFERYREAHMYNGLADYILKTDSKNSIIFTLSHSMTGLSDNLESRLQSNSEMKNLKINVVTLSQLNGLLEPSKEVDRIISDLNTDIVIFQFETKVEWQYLDLYKNLVDISQQQINANKTKSRVIFIAHNPSFDDVPPPEVSFTFASRYNLVSLDSLWPADISKLYRILISTPKDLLVNEDTSRAILEEAVNNEFKYKLNDIDHIAEVRRLNDIMYEFNVCMDVVLEVLKNNQDSLDDLQIDAQFHTVVPKELLLGSREDYIVDLVEDLPKLLTRRLISNIEVVLRAIHTNCDLYTLLRLGVATEFNSSNTSLTKLIKYWKDVASRTQIDKKISFATHNSRMSSITSIKESEEHKEVFMKHIFSLNKLATSSEPVDPTNHGFIEPLEYSTEPLHWYRLNKIVNGIESILMVIRAQAQNRKCENTYQTRLEKMREYLKPLLKKFGSFVCFKDKAQNDLNFSDFACLFSFYFGRKHQEKLALAVELVNYNSDSNSCPRELFAMICILIKTELISKSAATNYSQSCLTKDLIHSIQVYEEKLDKSEEEQVKFTDGLMKLAVAQVVNCELNPIQLSNLKDIATPRHPINIGHNYFDKYIGAVELHAKFMIGAELMKAPELAKNKETCTNILNLIISTLPLRRVDMREFGLRAHCLEVLQWIMAHSNKQILSLPRVPPSFNLSEVVNVIRKGNSFITFGPLQHVLKFVAVNQFDQPGNIPLTDYSTFNWDDQELFGMTASWQLSTVWP